MSTDKKNGGLGSCRAQSAIDSTSSAGAEPSTFTEEVFTNAMEGDMASLQAIPKADCHAHGILSAPFASYQRILDRVIKEPPKSFQGFEPFGVFISNVIFPIDSLSKTIQILKAAIEFMITDGVVLTQLSFDIRLFYNQDKQAVIEALSKLIETYKESIKVSFDLGVPREILDDILISQLKEVIEYKFFRTVDFYGNESFKLSEAHYQLIEYLRVKEVKVKLHWGEQGSGLLDELGRAKPDAIQHGIELARVPFQENLKQVPLHVCPASNIALNYVKNYKEHPISALQKIGYTVTLGSDDYALFGASLSQQYLKLYQTGNFSIEDLEHIRKNGLRC